LFVTQISGSRCAGDLSTLSSDFSLSNVPNSFGPVSPVIVVSAGLKAGFSDGDQVTNDEGSSCAPPGQSPLRFGTDPVEIYLCGTYHRTSIRDLVSTS
jgi:hypothetical protein